MQAEGARITFDLFRFLLTGFAIGFRCAPPHVAEGTMKAAPARSCRFTRLTNAFSKKVENHAAAIALYFMWYNFGRVHQTLRVTPAMEAGVTDQYLQLLGRHPLPRQRKRAPREVPFPSLQSRCKQPGENLVGATGFEPVTPAV
jgi:hypothetical protein